MRVLLIGSRHPWRVERAIERAFRRAGHHTLLLDDRKLRRAVGRALTQRWVLERAARFRPDFVYLSKCLALEPDTVRRIIADRPNAMWYHDPQWHADTDRRDIGHILTIGRLAHTFFVSGFDAEWRALGTNARYLPAAADREIVPVPPDPAYGATVSFIGTGYSPERAGFLLEVASHAPLRVWGSGWEPWADRLMWGGRPVERTEFAAVCSSSDIVLGANAARGGAAGAYASDRMWMVILGGGFYLGHGTPGVDRLLLDGVHCAWYRDVASCIERIEHYLAHPAERARVRSAGERFVREHHTYDRRLENLLSGAAFANPLEEATAPAGGAVSPV